MRKTLTLWLPVMLYAGFIFWLSAQPDPPVLGPMPLNDKLKHFSLYAVFAVLVWRALAASLRPPWAVAAATILLISLYGASDEFHQRFTPGRSCDVRDWLADTSAGATVALGLSFVLRRERPEVPESA